MVVHRRTEALGLGPAAHVKRVGRRAAGGRPPRRRPTGKALRWGVRGPPFSTPGGDEILRRLKHR
jgi:hypothetical protein